MMTQTLKNLLARTLIYVFSQISLKNCHRIGSVIGRLFSIIPNRNLHVTTINIQLCFPELDEQQQQLLIKKSLIEMGKTLSEVSPMWLWEKDKLFHFIKSVDGEELIQQTINNNQGVILALPHIGNWELLGLYISSKFPTTSMYQKPKIKEFDSLVKNGRQRFGAKLVPTDAQGIRAMLKALKSNQLICILPDQEPKEGNGIFAPFFDIQAYSMTLISRLARKTNAKVFMAYSERLPKGKGYKLNFIPLENLTNDSLENSVTYMNAEIEKCIHKIPKQYQWSYKRFRRQPKIKDQRITGKDFYNT